MPQWQRVRALILLGPGAGPGYTFSRVVIEGPPSWLLLHSLVVLRKRPVPHRHTHAVTKRMSEKPVRRIDDGNEAMPPRFDSDAPLWISDFGGLSANGHVNRDGCIQCS